MQEHESEGGRTPLMKACRAGHLCTVQFLVSKNADINRRTTNNDHTPLSLACAGGHFSIVQFLLDHGADMFHKLKVNALLQQFCEPSALEIELFQLERWQTSNARKLTHGSLKLKYIMSPALMCDH